MGLELSDSRREFGAGLFGLLCDVEKLDEGLVTVHRGFLCVLFCDCLEHTIGIIRLSEFLRECKMLVANSVVDPSTCFNRLLHICNILVRFARCIRASWRKLSGRI